MSPQQYIAHYRIVSKLGEGGMGAVYRASDTKLNREVAIKVLPDAPANDGDRLARFEREAQVLASLNHPNIAAIYGVENRAIIMELVEGDSPAGPLTEEEALPLVEQLVDALEYAHDRGVVHRDLKPANLKVTPDRRLKVLDFGLAKALSMESAAPDAANSPTLTMGATMAGVILGTAAYMSPEQARGHAVDKRSDIWSFGAVVFELLTGKRCFEGPTVSDTMAAVLMREPDLSIVPPRFRKLLSLCLVRDPKQRLRDISGARLLLEEPAWDVAPPVIGRRPWGWVAAGLLAVALAASLWLRPKSAEPGPSAVRFLVPFPPETTIPGVGVASPQWVLSPDGRNLAMAVRDNTGLTALWLRPLGTPSAHRIEHTEGATTPFWSPDSGSIAFFTQDKLKKVSLSSGALQTVCDLRCSRRRRRCLERGWHNCVRRSQFPAVARSSGGRDRHAGHRAGKRRAGTIVASIPAGWTACALFCYHSQSGVTGNLRPGTRIERPQVSAEDAHAGHVGSTWLLALRAGRNAFRPAPGSGDVAVIG